MIKLYHGTTNEAFCSIMKNGFCHNDVVWKCSDSNMLYFYNYELVAKEFELDEQSAINKCFEMALESAAFSAAITNSRYSNLFIFEFLIDDGNRNIIKSDNTMRNSSDCCVCIEAKLLNEIPHNIYYAPEHYTARLGLYYLSMLEKESLPELNLTRFERDIIENLIPINLDLFQSKLTDFFSELNIVLLHESACINDTKLSKGLEQTVQGKQKENGIEKAVKMENQEGITEVQYAEGKEPIQTEGQSFDPTLS